MKALAEARGLMGRLYIDSAGTHGWHVGEPPDPRAIAAARQRGVDLSGLRARRLRRKDLESFDLIIAMDRGHEAILRRLAPDGLAHRLRLFMDYLPERGARDVPDPYYGSPEDFAAVLDLIEHGARAILSELEPRLG